MEKFKNFSDESIAYLVKNDNTDAQLELLDRYRNRVNVIARSLYSKFKRNINCDLEDLVIIGMSSVIKAAITYKKGNSFNAYFTEIAENEMMDMIKESSESYLSDNKFLFVSFDDMEEIIGEFHDSSTYKSELYDALFDVVNSKKINATRRDKNMFIDYISGMSLKEIAHRRRLKPHVAKYKIDCIAEKIAKLIKK